MAEFDLIDRIRQMAGNSRGDVIVGIGDDAAVLEVSEGRQLVACCDTLNEGVHFVRGSDPFALGHKCLAVNLSDLAAMGAEPAWFLLSLSLPADDETWLERFVSGMLALARRHDIGLVGGDITSGPLSATVTAMGTIESGCAIGRAGACPGEAIAVSGTPGLAALALQETGAGRQPSAEARQALEMPEPRLRLSGYLRGLASACIDLSDGLIADLGHMLDASGVGAVVNLDSIPIHPQLQGLEQEQRRALILAGGDDYELCFTLPPGALPSLREIAEKSQTVLTVIGHTSEEQGLRCVESDGSQWLPTTSGFEHFGLRSKD